MASCRLKASFPPRESCTCVGDFLHKLTGFSFQVTAGKTLTTASKFSELNTAR